MIFGLFSICIEAVYLVILSIANMKNNRRIEDCLEAGFGLDWTLAIKGFAILIIMLGHLGNLFNMRYFTPLGAIGVACFLIAAGYGAESSYERKSLKNYWIKKLNVYIPYVIAEIIGYLTIIKPQSIVAVIKDLLLIDPLHPYGWYMQFIFVWYLVFYFGKKINHKYVDEILLFAIGCLYFVSARNLVAENAFSFIIGVELFKHKSQAHNMLKRKRTVVIFFSCGVLFLGVKQIPYIRALPALAYKLLLVVIPISFAFCIITMISILQFSKIKMVLSSFRSIGNDSFAIYLLHGFFINMIVSNPPSYVSIIIFFAVTFFASHIFSYINKKGISQSIVKLMR